MKFLVCLCVIGSAALAFARFEHHLTPVDPTSETVTGLLEQKTPTFERMSKKDGGLVQNQPDSAAAESRAEYRARAIQAFEDYLTQQNTYERMKNNQLTAVEMKFANRVIKRLYELRAEAIQEKINKIELKLSMLRAKRER